ncbi:GGDEF domain-containing protein [Pararhizobium sp. O133]|uniref:GGDEF domain-containing protein n=1 Tax=Pararhizobium sp. O133 TaxID=3449278 RepID=UPI003F6877BC
MDVKNNANLVMPAPVASLNTPQQLSPALAAEVERQLAGRTRDIRLNKELAELFRQRSWPQASKIIRAWLIWVAVIDILTLGMNAILLPAETVTSMILPAAIVPPVALATAVAFTRPVSLRKRRLTALSGLFVILLCLAQLGVHAGAEFYERHLTIMLFVAVTAIIIFPLPLIFAVATAVFSIGLCLVFQLQNPAIGTGSALSDTLFFSIGVLATVVARRTANILAHKTFLLELRDRNRLADLTDANTQLERLAGTDPLTGVANRRSMGQSLHAFWTDNIGNGKGVAILMCDIDHFKRLNDTLGHAEGDRCLVAVAKLIRACLRDGIDQVSRYGGEEFLILLPGADEQAARVVSERIRSEIEAAALPNPASSVIPYVTVSIGVAVLAQNSEAVSAERLQKRADVALYRAKESGRNRVVVYAPDIGS